METALIWLLGLHWPWYVPIYLATGVIVSTITVKVFDLDRYEDPPPSLIAAVWPIALVVVIAIGLNALIWKLSTIRLPDPRRMKRRIQRALKQESGKNTVAYQVDEAGNPNWAHWQ